MSEIAVGVYNRLHTDGALVLVLEGVKANS